MSGAYYNEIDPFAASWLRELIKAGLIADGEVDERSIELVRPDDLRGFVQCHFFAGIGGWSLALRLAGWDDARAVWTGSCPCQPFSSAGAQTGGNDSRDLWPVWFQLVKECRPVVVFGEQVEAAIGHGWLDRLCDDLEAEDYAVGAVGLPGPCVGAFDIRQRLWFVADADERHAEHGALQRGGQHGLRAQGRCADGDAGFVEQSEGRMADAEHAERWPLSGPVEDERDGHDAGRQEAHRELGARRQVRNVADAAEPEGRRRRLHRSSEGAAADSGRQASDQPERNRVTGDMADTAIGGFGIDGSASRDTGHVDECESAGVVDIATSDRPQGGRALHGEHDGQISDGGFWSGCDWVACSDGKARPVEPGTFPLAHGVPARVGRLRGYGNAIKPQVAAAFVEAYMSVSA